MNYSNQFKTQKTHSYLRMYYVLILLFGLFFSGQMHAQTTYCNFTTYNPAYQMVPNFVSINNITIMPFNVTEAGVVDNGVNNYIDKTNITLNVFRGTQYSLYFGAGWAQWTTYPNLDYYSQDAKVYIDFNQDGEFNETNERLYFYDSDGSLTTTFWHDLQFTIPSDALVGNTRLRIVCDYWQDVFATGTTLAGCNGTNGYASSLGGAVDFTVRIAPGNDAGAVAITEPSGAYSPGKQNIVVTIQNNSDKTLTSCQVNASVDGVNVTPTTWNGSLEFGETADVTIGQYNFIYKTPMSAYTVAAWTSLPNGYADEDASNDYAPEIQTAPSLTPGTYTIGCNNPSFQTVQTAVNYLMNGGILGSGDCIFSICGGSYTGHIDLSKFDSQDNKIIFRSANNDKNSVFIDYSVTDLTTDATWNISQIENFIQFENLTFRVNNTGVGAAKIFDIQNSNKVHFNNCAFIGAPNPTEDPLHSVIYIKNTPNFLMQNSVINYGSYGIFIDNTASLADFAILNNTFVDFNYSAAFINNSIANSNIKINNNVFSIVTGIQAANAITVTNGTEIVNNMITGLNGTTPVDIDNKEAAIVVTHTTNAPEATINQNTISNCSNISGIYLDNVNGGEVSKNTITIDSDDDIPFACISTFNAGSVNKHVKLIVNSLNGNASNGMNLKGSFVKAYKNTIRTSGNGQGYSYAIVANNSTGYLANNMILGSESGAFFLGQSNDMNVYYNSAKCSNKESSIIDIIDGNNKVKRNIFINSDGPILTENSGINGAEILAINENLEMDQNNLFTKGSTLVVWDNNPLANLEEWQDYSEQDKNSTSMDIKFISATNLHLAQFYDEIFESYGLFGDNSIQRAEFEDYDFDGEYRRGYYYGIDQIQPHITVIEQPEEIINCYGTENLALSVIASASLGSVPDYQWQKDGIDIPGAAKANYNLPALNYSMEGIYRCKITGSGGAIQVFSDAVVLSVITQTDITRQPKPCEVNEGETASFFFDSHVLGDAARFDIQPNIQWYKITGTNPDTIALVDDYNIGGRIAGAKSNILSIRSIKADDYKDLYYAIIDGRCGSTITANTYAYKPANINITNHPESVIACLGDKAELNVVATPTVTGVNILYQWRKNGVDIAGANSANLVLDPTTATDEAEYDCVLTLDQGDAKKITNSAFVAIQEKPIINTQPVSQSLKEDTDDLILVVVASGDPIILYQWQKDGVDIAGANSATYTKSPVKTADNGSYVCVVSNNCGSVPSNPADIEVTTVNISDVLDNNEATFELIANNPNPVTDNTEIVFFATIGANVKLTISDMYGREIAIPFNGIVKSNKNIIKLDVNSMNLASGVYYYTLSSKSFSDTKQMVIVK